MRYAIKFSFSFFGWYFTTTEQIKKIWLKSMIATFLLSLLMKYLCFNFVIVTSALTADALISTGLANLGYIHVNIGIACKSAIDIFFFHGANFSDLFFHGR